MEGGGAGDGAGGGGDGGGGSAPVGGVGGVVVYSKLSDSWGVAGPGPGWAA